MMDTDIGQTEFTPPGCISLFNVDGPILSKLFLHLNYLLVSLAPPFLHQRKFFPSTYCIGSLSPGGQDILLYYRGIEKAAEDFANISDSKKFLVVNTHGWVDGKGAEIMKRIMQIVKPSYVLNMIGISVQNFDVSTI